MDDLLRMQELQQQGFYCSQILLMLGLEAQGKHNPDLIRAMHALCGGLGFTGDICGALTGGTCLLGLYAGKGLPTEEEDFLLRVMIDELVEWFKTEYGQMYGGINCTHILEDNPRNRATRCPAIVANVYQQVKELLVANGFDLAGQEL
jgi:C_GCAxxG_C_C family probable redox protein